MDWFDFCWSIAMTLCITALAVGAVQEWRRTR